MQFETSKLTECVSRRLYPQAVDMENSLDPDQSLSLFGDLPFPETAWSGELWRGQQMQSYSLARHLIQPLEARFDNRISNVYSSFRDYARRALGAGNTEERVLGTRDLDAGVILSSTDHNSASMLSKWCGEAISSCGIQSQASKLGTMLLMHKLMRVSRLFVCL